MKKNALIGIILIAFVAASSLTFCAGEMYGRKRSMEETSIIDGLWGARVDSYLMMVSLVALRDGDQKKVPQFLGGRLILSAPTMAVILESYNDSDHANFFSKECPLILTTDDGVRAGKVLDGLPEKDVGIYEEAMRRIRDACNRVKAPM